MSKFGYFYVLATIRGVEFFVFGLSLRRSRRVDAEARKWGTLEIESIFSEWELAVPAYTLRIVEVLPEEMPPILVQAKEYFKKILAGGCDDTAQ